VAQRHAGQQHGSGLRCVRRAAAAAGRLSLSTKLAPPASKRRFTRNDDRKCLMGRRFWPGACGLHRDHWFPFTTQKHTMSRSIKHLALPLLLALGAAQASAATVTWADWTTIGGSGASGSIGGVGVSISGTTDGVSQAGCGAGAINYWIEPDGSQRPYTGGTVSNGPTACEQVGLNTATTITVTFTSAVDNLYMALLSVGQPSLEVTYDFDRAFTIDSAGVGYWSGGVPGAYTQGAGDTLAMKEFHGMLRLSGSGITSFSFTTNPGENWHAFTLGTAAAAVPAPGTLALAGLAMLALGAAARRRA
jgi:hypothetical protein